MPTKKTISDSDLRDMAQSLEHWAGRYRELAAMLPANNLDRVRVTGSATFTRILEHLGSNTRRIRVQIQKAIDEREADNSP